MFTVEESLSSTSKALDSYIECLGFWLCVAACYGRFVFGITISYPLKFSAWSYFVRYLVQLQRAYYHNSYFRIKRASLIRNGTLQMVLASDAECWCFIVSENCVCDVMQNLL